MTTIRWRGRFIASAMIVLALIVTALLVGLRDDNKVNGADSKPSGDESTTTTTSTTDSTTTSSTLPLPIGVPEGELEVKPGDILPEAARCTSDEFIPNSLPSIEKLWSDSVSTPYGSSDPNEMFAEQLVENCGNPTALDMTVQGLKEVKIGNFSIWEHNPWMADFLNLADEHGLRAAFLTKKEGVDGIFVTAEYQLFAEMANTILLDYKVRAGVETLLSSQNWHLPGPTAGELPRVVENENQEGLPALILEYTLKGVCEPASVIGYNTGDKRFEIFGSPKCETPPVTVTTSPPPTPPTTPATTPTPTTTPPTTPATTTVVTTPATTTVVTTPATTTTPTTSPPPTTAVGRKGTPATTTPPPPTTAAPSTTTTTLPCVTGTHRDPATALCVSDNPPAEDPAPDPSVPSGGNDGPIPDPGV